MPTYEPGSRARCPHCLVTVRFEADEWRRPDGAHFGVLGRLIACGPQESLLLVQAVCPECGRVVITVAPGVWVNGEFILPQQEIVVWPRSTARSVPPEVPQGIAEDYTEAALVLPLSPKASAALSRRCLQHVLRDQGYNQKELAQQIDAALPSLPAYIVRDVDAIRNIGNFAAHPMKSRASGEILDVEPAEAEWNLEVLDALFDFYYVQDALRQQRRALLNERLQAAGKPPMK